MKKHFAYSFVLTVNFFLSLSGDIISQSKLQEEQIKYSDLDSWYFRTFTESSILGGETKKLFEIGTLPKDKTTKLSDSIDEESPWSTTNLHAKIVVDIGNTCVFPEENEGGYCCRMESKLREINIIGLNLKVLVAGAIFLGEFIEPIESVMDPIKNLDHGVPFTSKPKSIQFDYKYSPGASRIKSVFVTEQVDGPDKAEFCLILQKRWEDENGNVFAIRIGGARNFFSGTKGEWVMDTTINLHYGDISKMPFYEAKTMDLIPKVNDLYVKNSRGKMVSLVETAWDTANQTPTHLILYFASSYEGINYIGSPESVLWVDNIEFVY